MGLGVAGTQKPEAMRVSCTARGMAIKSVVLWRGAPSHVSSGVGDVAFLLIPGKV